MFHANVSLIDVQSYFFPMFISMFIFIFNYLYGDRTEMIVLKKIEGSRLARCVARIGMAALCVPRLVLAACALVLFGYHSSAGRGGSARLFAPAPRARARPLASAPASLRPAIRAPGAAAASCESQRRPPEQSVARDTPCACRRDLPRGAGRP